MKTPEWLSDWVNYSMSEWKTINLRTEDFLPKINYEGWILPVSRNFSGTSEDMEWRHRNQKLVSHRLKALGIPFPKSERTTLYFYQIVVHYPMRKREIEICNLISLRHFFYIVSSHPVWNLFRQILVQYSLPGCHLIKVPMAHGE